MERFAGSPEHNTGNMSGKHTDGRGYDTGPVNSTKLQKEVQKMKRKVILPLLLAATMTFTPTAPVFAAEAQEQTVAEAEPGEQAAAQPEGTSETGGENKDQSEEKKAGPADSVVQVITGYLFEDGSVDVWMSGTGLYIGNEQVVTTMGLVGFAGKSDSRYQSVASRKADAYKSVGIDVDDYLAMMEGMKTYLCLPDGTYQQCEVLSRNKKTNLAMISYKAAENDKEKNENGEKDKETVIPVTPIKFTEKTIPESVSLTGFQAGVLEATGDAIAAGQEKAEPVKAETTTVPVKLDDAGNIQIEGKVNRGFIGAVLTNEAGEALGIVTDVSGEKAMAVPTETILLFMDGSLDKDADSSEGMDDPEEQADLVEKKDRLNKAVDKAKAVDMSGCPEDIVNAFNKAVENAEKTLRNVNASSEEIETAGNDLNNVNRLVDIGPSLILAREWAAKTEEGPEKESLDKAIKGAEALIADPGAPEDTFKSVQEELNTASEAAKASAGMDVNAIGKIAAMVIIPVSVIAAAAIAVVSALKKKKNKDDADEDSTEDPENGTEKKPKKSGKLFKKKEKGGKDEKEKERTTPKSHKQTDSGYGGELAREARKYDENEDEESGTSVLGSGAADTTVLNKHAMIKGYFTTEDGSRIDITKREFTIGKERRKVTYCITGNPTVSRKHCLVKIDGENFCVEDLESLNGTYINGVKLSPHKLTMISDGDKLTLSDVDLIFHIGE